LAWVSEICLDWRRFGRFCFSDHRITRCPDQPIQCPPPSPGIPLHSRSSQNGVDFSVPPIPDQCHPCKSVVRFAFPRGWVFWLRANGQELKAVFLLHSPPGGKTFVANKRDAPFDRPVTERSKPFFLPFSGSNRCCSPCPAQAKSQ
jgi:hypothetical protein